MAWRNAKVRTANAASLAQAAIRRGTALGAMAPGAASSSASSTSSINQALRPATSFTALVSEMPAASLTALVRDVSSLMRELAYASTNGTKRPHNIIVARPLRQGACQAWPVSDAWTPRP